MPLFMVSDHTSASKKYVATSEIENDGPNSREDGVASCDNMSEDTSTQDGEDCAEMTQIELGNIRVSKLGIGRIVSDLDYFHNKKDIWPEGYTTFRKFTSVKDPHLTSYRKEVLRNLDIKARPLFRVISEDRVQYLPYHQRRSSRYGKVWQPPHLKIVADPQASAPLVAHRM